MRFWKRIVLSVMVSSVLALAGRAAAADGPEKAGTATPAAAWSVGAPIVTYWAGPAMDEAVARQMVEGGFNVVWCAEGDLDLLQRHGLRGMLHHPLLSPATLDAPAELEKLDALIDRVSKHPAFYAYFLTDEPSAAAFPALGKLMAHLRSRDPAHLAYINLFPTYATNAQLGTAGSVEAAYREHLRRFVEEVKPALLSYDHYQFYKDGDTDQYFLNLALVRAAAQKAGVPFLNIVQASAWQPGVRVPTADETRYLVYTTLAYGAQGISYYVYFAPGHEGGIADATGRTTPIYNALRGLNREFAAIAKELQPLRSLAVYHTAMKQPGCTAPPADALFHLDPTTAAPGAAAAPAPGAAPGAAAAPRGLLLGLFGPKDRPTHAVVVNLDYRTQATATLTGPGKLEEFDPATGKWSSGDLPRAELRLPPGGGRLLRIVE